MMRWLLLPAFIVFAVACGSVQQERFVLDLRTQSDDGSSLAGVVVYHKDRPLGESTNAGQLRVAVAAVAGEHFPLRFECPKGFKATREQVRVPLRTTSDENRYQMVLACKPNKRKAFIAVATNMANVPLRLGDDQVAVTNGFGVAYVTLDRAAHQPFELTMDTSSVPRLLPRNPVFQFKMPDRDETFVVQETLYLEELPPPPPKPKKRKKRRKKAKKKKRPTRLTGTKAGFGTLKK